MNFSRRELLKSKAGLLAFSTSLTQVASGMSIFSGKFQLGPLLEPDSNGIKLPEGYKSRVIATTGSKVSITGNRNSDYIWHRAPDGGACFAMDDGGWVYACNSEIQPGGGVGAIRFNSKGEAVDAYSILENTRRNCAGGPSPWGTWFSCEEVSRGKVFECFVESKNKRAKTWDGLGWFKHEAIAFDPNTYNAYLTEDERDGCFYRYVPKNPQAPNLYDQGQGKLQVAQMTDDGHVTWLTIDNPNPSKFQKPTRHQVPKAERFNGGEGIWYHEGAVYFTTKGDNRVWVYNIEKNTVGLLYDKATSKSPTLSGVDNVTVAPDGSVIVAEDGGDMQLVVLDEFSQPRPLLQIMGQNRSEITGPAFSPDHKRLYFNSQRGRNGNGITYEITGPFVS